MDDLTGTQIGRDGHRYPLGDPRLLIPPPPPRVTSVNGKTGDVVLALGGGAAMKTDTPAVAFRYQGDLAAWPLPPDLNSFSSPLLNQVTVIAPDGAETDYDPIDILGSDPAAAVTGAADFGLVSNDNTGNIPQAGILEAGLYNLSGSAMFGAASDVGVRILWVALPYSSDLSGNNQFETKVFHLWPKADSSVWLGIPTTVVAQNDLEVAGVPAGEPSQFSIGVQQNSDVDPMPVTVTLYLRRIL